MKVFLAHSSRDLEFVESLAGYLRQEGHSVVLPAKLSSGASVQSEISAAIRAADVLVAVLTASTPSIFYELGLATGASIPILITAESSERLPADLASIPYVQLTGDPLRDAQIIVRRIGELEGLTSKKSRKFTSADATLRAASRDPAFLETLSPTDFEQLVGQLFKERGYEVVSGGAVRDSGADIIIRSKKNEVVLVELKKLNRLSRVSVESVRNLLSTVSNFGASVGMLVSTSGFTASALALAASTTIVLRTLDEILAAQSEDELVGPALSFSKSEAEARAILREMADNGIIPNAASYAVLLNFAKSEAEARAILREMIDNGVAPNVATYSTLLKLAKSEAEARAIQREMQANGIGPDIVTYNSLLNFAKSEAEARAIQREMQANGIGPDIVTYNTILNFAKSEAEARAIQREMQANGIGPDIVTYNTILNFAKSEDEARAVQREMLAYGIMPDIAFYNCLLSYVKSAAEARAIIKEINDNGLVPDATSYNTLLNFVATEAERPLNPEAANANPVPS
ncbi:restriction endonuclease [Rhodopseudomonas palustris]|nr:restriction endonuclease [Rhodopseudomonas palustris]